jgi:hypothetical protein
VGYDIEPYPYPGELRLEDVATLNGAQFSDASIIVASPPCQAYSYRAMPWKRAKALGPPDNTLFDACWRIQAEAIAAAGRYIPLIVENVRGAVKWVSQPVRWHYGSYYLWGDVPALMPMTISAVKVPGLNWKLGSATYTCKAFNTTAEQGLKVPSGNGRRTDVGNGTRFTSRDCGIEGVKEGGDWRNMECRRTGMARHGSQPPARKAASAAIAKIPLPLAQHIARVYYPQPPERQEEQP